MDTQLFHERIRAVSVEDRLRIAAMAEEDLGRVIARHIPPYALAAQAVLRRHHQPSSDHSFGLAVRARVAAVVLGIDHTELGRALVLAAFTHDIGKIGVPVEILSAPRKLTPEERRILRIHPTLSFELMRGVLLLPARIGVQHHEHGLVEERYPRDPILHPRLTDAESEVVTLGRLLSRLDKLDAWLENRSYRSAIPPTEAVQKVMEVHRPGFEDVIVAAAEVRPRNAAF